LAENRKLDIYPESCKLFSAKPFGRHFRCISLAFSLGNSFGYSLREKASDILRKCRWHRRIY